jgi:hypothetical protein
LSARETGKVAAQKHHLFLIYRYSVGVFQTFFHNGNIVNDWVAPMLAGNKVRNITHWAGTIKGIHRNEVFELGGT